MGTRMVFEKHFLLVDRKNLMHLVLSYGDRRSRHLLEILVLVHLVMIMVHSMNAIMRIMLLFVVHDHACVLMAIVRTTTSNMLNEEIELKPRMKE